MYCIIHGSLILIMSCKSLWWTMKGGIQFNCKLLNSFNFNCISLSHMMKMSIVGDSVIRKKAQFNGATVYAIVNNRLSALKLAITPDMGHDGWANDVTLSNIHECSLFTSRFHLYKNTKVSMETRLVQMLNKGSNCSNY